MSASATLAPDKEVMRTFKEVLFRHADPDAFVIFKAWDDDSNSVFPAEGILLSSTSLVDFAFNRAKQTSEWPRAAAFCPPVATFKNTFVEKGRWLATEADVANGIAISVDADKKPVAALRRLEALLGEPTLVTSSGGLWTDPDTGEVEERAHLHWVLRTPTRTQAEHDLLYEARWLACMIVEGDATLAPISHCLRWAGSVHNKGEPRLARIVSQSTNEVDLTEALVRLRETWDGDPLNGTAQSNGLVLEVALKASDEDVQSALAVIPNVDLPWFEWKKKALATWAATEGRGYKLFEAWSKKSHKHDAAKTIKEWTAIGRSPPVRIGAGSLFYAANQADPAWAKPSGRGPDASRLFEPQDEAPGGAAEATPLSPQPRFKSGADFIKEYEPLSYAIDPLVRSGSLYTITAPTGAGKTAWLILVLLAILTGRKDILGIEVECGRVAFLTFENPDDVRMRLMVAACVFGVDLGGLGDLLLILDQREKPEWIETQLRALSRAGPFKLILIDTLAAFFDGDDINNNVQGGNFMRRIRPMTRLLGLPSVVVASHPVKNATESQLVPYGSGAILNEVDANLTLWRKPDTGITTLHWQGKMRGWEFKPVTYKIRAATSPEVIDTKGRLVELPYLVAATDEDEDVREAAEIDIDVQILRALLADPKIKQRDLAAQVDRTLSVINAKLQRFERDRWISTLLNVKTVTKKGRDVLLNQA